MSKKKHENHSEAPVASEGDMNAQQEHYAREQLSAAKRLNTISAIGAAVAFLAVVAASIYACIAHSQLKAALEANRLSRESSAKAYRPYVGIDGTSVTFQPASTVSASDITSVPNAQTARMNFGVSIKNFGPVPGTDFAAKWRIFVGGVEQPEIFFSRDISSTIFPTQAVTLRGAIGGSDYLSIQEGKPLEIEVSVVYSDANGTYSYCERQRYEPPVHSFLSLGTCSK